MAVRISFPGRLLSAVRDLQVGVLRARHRDGQPTGLDHFRIAPHRGGEKLHTALVAGLPNRRQQFFDYLRDSVAVRSALMPIGLMPGDAVVWKDDRMLHGRNAFVADRPGERFLWKCDLSLLPLWRSARSRSARCGSTSGRSTTLRGSDC